MVSRRSKRVLLITAAAAPVRAVVAWPPGE